MRKIFIPITILLMISACSQSSKNEQALQKQIDELGAKIDNAYKPGFGDFMGSIQNHHNKLWFAGINENWELADFAMHELEELFDDIKTMHPDRDETKAIPMIEPGMVAVDNAIEQQNKEEFKRGYITLTNNCNTCHQATKHEYIKIKIPTAPSYSNQDFTRWFDEMKNNTPNNNKN